jgi:hypothetical protein
MLAPSAGSVLADGAARRRTVVAVTSPDQPARDRLGSWAALVGIFAANRADAYAALATEFAADPPLPGPHAPLVVLHAVRRAALQGRATDPWSGDPAAVRRDIIRLRPEIEVALRRGLVQYTDPQRMTDLLPGLLLASSRYPGRPLRLVELGACAGVLLVPDRYRIRYPGASWTPTGAVLDLESELAVPRGLLGLRLDIEDALGVDLDPVDPATGYDYLRAFTWPGDHAREPRLRAALAAVAADPVPILAGDVNDLLPEVLDEKVGRDVVTVVIESAVSSYLGGPSILRLGRLLDQAAARGPLVLLSRTAAPANARGLRSGATVSDLSGRWRSAYAATDALSERAAWTAAD